MPATLTLTDGQTQTVPGTDLRLTLVAVPFNCPPNASCLPAPWGRLTAHAGAQAPVEFPVAGPLAGPQPVREVDVYRLTVLDVADAAQPYRCAFGWNASEPRSPSPSGALRTIRHRVVRRRARRAKM